MADEPTRPVASGTTEDGHETVSSVTTPTDFPTRSKALLMPRTIIPIVFVPGIMGTLLREKKVGGKRVWSPPNNKVPEGVSLLANMAFTHAAARQEMWNPATTEVDDSGKVAPNDRTKALLSGPGKTAADNARFRGWGQLHWDSYGSVLNVLEEQLAHMLQEAPTSAGDVEAHSTDKPDAELHPTEFWQGIIKVAEPGKWGAQKAFAPLTDAELKRAAKAAYPVHAVGYNWLQSNADSGIRLSSEIDKIIQYYSETMKRNCDKVIVVTHSMGGLVARACSQLSGGSGKILGVLHGVQPAIGAPATYKRMRAGFEGVPSVVLGRDAAECTAVLANSPGGLELLPTAEYLTQLDQGETRHWLCAANATGDANAKPPRIKATLLGQGNPYQTIYQDKNSDHWWRMIDEKLLDPAKLAVAKANDNPRTSGSPAWNKYMQNLDNVEAFHGNLKGQYHALTHAYYSADPDQASWRQASWSSKSVTAGDPTEAPTLNDDWNGKINVKMGDDELVYEIDGPDGPGDGTVPAYSAAAQTDHSTQIFKHEGKDKDHFSYDHQHSYGNPMTQELTLYTIVKIALTSPLLDKD